VLSAADALALVPDGGRIYLQGQCGEPPTLAAALSRLPAGVEVVVAPLRGVNPCEYAGTAARLTALTYAPALGDPARYVRVRSSEMPRLLAGLEFDVALVQVGPTGDNLGTCVDLIPEAVARARHVVAEVNPHLPWTHGATAIEPTDVVRGTARPRTLARGPLSARDEAIAANVAAVVPHGATMQVGIGRLADAVFAALASHRRLAIHSGMITDAVVPLAAAGVVTGPIVTTQVIGSDDLYRFVHRNPRVAVQPVTSVHAAEAMAGLQRFCAVNFAVEVDLLGQVNAEWVGDRRVGGVGGMLDFLEGAARSPGGAAIVALPAERIVARIAPRRVTSAHVGVIVTEHGAADLRGAATDAERARAVAAVAPPERRAELLRSLDRNDGCT
jgi:acetyl-CoA hydrolase